MFETYGLEIINVKHPQEVRKTSQISGNFLFTEKQHLYAIRLQYGRDFLLFQKGTLTRRWDKGVWQWGQPLVWWPHIIERSLDRGGLATKEQYDPKNPAHEYGDILGNGEFFTALGNQNSDGRQF